MARPPAGGTAWSRRLEKRVPRVPPERVCGVEHEFEVHGPRGRVDGRMLVPSLAVGRRREDPTDPHARLLPDGAVLTADGAEAEIAIPPVRVSPGFTRVADASAAAARRTLEAALPAEVRLVGYSTHLSVSVPDRRAAGCARFVATRLAPLLMLALDQPTSPGLLVRARYGRLELCGDFVEGTALRAALAVGVAVGLESVRRRPGRGLPPAPSVRLEPSRERFGWYVDRRALGPDLYDGGRDTVLPTSSGPVLVQTYLQECWSVVRTHLAGVCDAEERALADDLVSGRVRSGLDR